VLGPIEGVEITEGAIGGNVDALALIPFDEFSLLEPGM
jgi:hypothetical protein